MRPRSFCSAERELPLRRPLGRPGLRPDAREMQQGRAEVRRADRRLGRVPPDPVRDSSPVSVDRAVLVCWNRASGDQEWIQTVNFHRDLGDVGLDKSPAWSQIIEDCQPAKAVHPDRNFFQ